jgi:hypothetical protein
MPNYINNITVKILIVITLILIPNMYLLYLWYKEKEFIENGYPLSVITFKKEGQLTFISSKSDVLKIIDIEIANNDVKRSIGLMWRIKLPEYGGMLFIFENESNLSFWMKNTRIPLDIIFVNNKHEIVNIQYNTIPFSKDKLNSNKPTQYVIEVNAGFCSKYHVMIGDKVQFI